MRKPLLFLPGPMQVPDHIRAAGDRPLFSHRSAQMNELLTRLEEGSKPLFGTRGTVIFPSASGSGAMESAVCNLTSPGGEVIVVVGGAVAELGAHIATAFRGPGPTVDGEWPQGPTVAADGT